MMSDDEAKVRWQWYLFEQLSVHQLYALLRLRERVFQLEQHSLYQDIDGRDAGALHLLVSQRDRLVGYLRLVDAGSAWHPGRIVLERGVRGAGLGRQLIHYGIEKARALDAQKAIRIAAQQALAGYYRELGFEVCSEPYDDGGVAHVDMVLGVR